MEERMDHQKDKNGGELQEAKLEQLMRRLEETENEKKEYAKWQFYMSAATAICSVFVLALLFSAYLTLVPRAKATFDEIGTVTQDLNEISKQLSSADLAGLVENMNHMAVTSEKGVQEALEKIQSIDIDELNEAIKGLSDVVSPFAKFMNRFGG